jgi:hypothetical protein
MTCEYAGFFSPKTTLQNTLFGSFFDHFGDYKKSFFRAWKNTVFLKVTNRLISLVQTHFH